MRSSGTLILGSCIGRDECPEFAACIMYKCCRFHLPSIPLPLLNHTAIPLADDFLGVYAAEQAAVNKNSVGSGNGGNRTG
jgi:hypothetical protein